MTEDYKREMGIADEMGDEETDASAHDPVAPDNLEGDKDKDLSLEEQEELEEVNEDSDEDDEEVE